MVGQSREYAGKGGGGKQTSDMRSCALQPLHHIPRQPRRGRIRAQRLKNSNADFGVLVHGGSVNFLGLLLAVDADAGNEEDRARADEARDHLPPGEAAHEAFLVFDVVQ